MIVRGGAELLPPDRIAELTADPEPDFEDEAEEGARREALRAQVVGACAHLTRAQAAVVGRLLAGESHVEIARSLGVDPATVRTLRRRAEAALRRRLHRSPESCLAPDP